MKVVLSQDAEEVEPAICIIKVSVYHSHHRRLDFPALQVSRCSQESSPLTNDASAKSSILAHYIFIDRFYFGILH